MSKFKIRNVSDETMSKLRKLAEEHGHSIEEEVRQILERESAVTSVEKFAPNAQP